jgi:serine phosphatase RsbU (regulator of sigma subunit)
MNEARETYGPERIESIARADDMSTLSASAILARVSGDVQSFAGTASQHDDMTLVVVKVL